MLGSLSKYLRMCNFDTVFIKNISDNDLIEEALQTNRILLTRDKKLTERRIIKENSIKLVLIKSDYLYEQLQQVKDTLKINFNLDLQRCIKCNTVLNQLKKENIMKAVPHYIYQTHNIFLECSNCKKIYWKGSHVDQMKDFFNKYFS